MTVQFNSGFFASASRFWFGFCTPFPGCPHWVIIFYNKNPELFNVRFWLTSKDDSSSCAILSCLAKLLSFNLPWEFPNKAINHMQVLKHGDEPSDCESSCLCCYSYIADLGLHAVYITHYVIRITKHLRNRIEIERQYSKSNQNRKEYEYFIFLHP